MAILLALVPPRLYFLLLLVPPRLFFIVIGVALFGSLSGGSRSSPNIASANALVHRLMTSTDLCHQAAGKAINDILYDAKWQSIEIESVLPSTAMRTANGCANYVRSELNRIGYFSR